ncbi:hypothetical protein J5N97_024638 [Dioscorea zingiberensis]|uniref:Homeobox domain-containing protein n=1 Tax=Dioscorea zingiberensis TaxID=325984 RepID=A0A9D5C6V8_9LILI|nr:hypothetical protein J5N97_024638 [Dioscorea zingiberensis]
MAEDDPCDTGLVLGLGFGGKPSLSNPKHRRRDPSCPNQTSAGALLTLSLSDDAFTARTPAFNNPLSTVKKEMDVGVDQEAMEADLVSISLRASDEEDDGAARKKLRLTKEQSSLLEDRFKEHSTLNPKQKQVLAKQLNLRPRQVEVWFQNRRARTKLKQTEVDCEVLKRCCEALTDENRRLQKELQELKAIKLSATPLYMQLPAATLSICPSCESLAGANVDSTKAGAGSAFVLAPKHHLYKPFSHPATC